MAREAVVLLGQPTEQRHQQCTAHTESLCHAGRHVTVQLHLLAREVGQLPPDNLGRDEEDRQHDQCRHRELPAQHQHGGQHENQTDDVGQHCRKRRGEGLLGSNDVGVEPGHQLAGLGAGEERDGHLDDVIEDLRAQIEDEAFTDLRGAPALYQPQDRLEHRQCGHRRGENDQQLSIALQHALVDDLLEQQRWSDRQTAGDDHECDEDRNQYPVGPGEPQNPRQHTLGQLMLRHLRILAEPAHHPDTHRTHRRHGGSVFGGHNKPARTRGVRAGLQGASS